MPRLSQLVHDLVIAPFRRFLFSYGDDVGSGLALYSLTLIATVLGLSFSVDFIKSYVTRSDADDLTTRASLYDGGHYRDIALHGYKYNPGERSTVAFFPAYPLLARLIMLAIGCSVEWALLIISNAGCLTCLVLFGAYVRNRPSATADAEGRWSSLAFAVWPMTLFMRLAYTESLFCLLALLTLLGIARRWPLWLLISLAGLCSAVRPVGCAVSAVLCCHVLWSPDYAARRGSKVLVSLLFSAWGLVAYMVYLYAAFGDPLAFARTQEHWRYAAPPGTPMADKALSLLTLEPIWSLYDSDSAGYWARIDPRSNMNPLFSLMFWNPILFLTAALTIAIGWFARLLNGVEVLLGVLLLAIPYVTKGFEMSMGSQGRFAAVILPIYVVYGHALARLPPTIAASVCVLSGIMLSYWTTLYGAGYRVF